MNDSPRFFPATLSFNIGGIENVAACNPGGSVACRPGSHGCGKDGFTCCTASCSGKSAFELTIDSEILAERDTLEKLHGRLLQVLTEFGR